MALARIHNIMYYSWVRAKKKPTSNLLYFTVSRSFSRNAIYNDAYIKSRTLRRVTRFLSSYTRIAIVSIVFALKFTVSWTRSVLSFVVVVRVYCGERRHKRLPLTGGNDCGDRPPCLWRTAISYGRKNRFLAVVASRWSYDLTDDLNRNRKRHLRVRESRGAPRALSDSRHKTSPPPIFVLYFSTLFLLPRVLWRIHFYSGA